MTTRRFVQQRVHANKNCSDYWTFMIEPAVDSPNKGPVWRVFQCYDVMDWDWDHDEDEPADDFLNENFWRLLLITYGLMSELV